MSVIKIDTRDITCTIVEQLRKAVKEVSASLAIEIVDNQVLLYAKDIADAVIECGDPIETPILSGRCKAWSYPGHLSWDPQLNKPDGRQCAMDIGHDGNHELTGPWTGGDTVEIIDEGGRVRIRVREPSGKASAYVSDARLEQFAKEIARVQEQRARRAADALIPLRLSIECGGTRGVVEQRDDETFNHFINRVSEIANPHWNRHRVGDQKRCTMRSSVTLQQCELDAGHAADSPTRYHRFSPVEQTIALVRDSDDHHEPDDTLERIYCTRAGQIMHQGCGWCAQHNRPSFECLCNGVRVTVRADLPVPRCEHEACTSPVVHGEHWHDKLRWWCDTHVPMSGHHEYCPEPCITLVKHVTPPSVFSDLAATYAGAHLRSIPR